MAYKYTNKNNISLALAVFLMHDSYDYDDRANVISATGLLKSIRQIVLAHQNKDLAKTVDISDLVPSRMGTAIHNGCEEAWLDRKNVLEALKVFGAADSVTDSIRVNPETITPGEMPVYVEQRAEKEINNTIISGKYDLVLDGVLNDYKSTSVWTYIYDSNSDNYIKQGSIYKWLSPDKITSDIININYIFTDWSAARAKQDGKRYPQQRVITKEYPLWSTEETEQWITNKLESYQALIDSPQQDLPECDDTELWASETVYKYYKNPASTAKSTKNFATMDEALMRQSADGNVGTVKEVPGEVKACRYCSVVGICEQAENMLASGRLNL
tara:strand:- start:6687 stop:7673 length:987 start_codon:yes stop_codon:yes gene_type:complete